MNNQTPQSLVETLRRMARWGKRLDHGLLTEAADQIERDEGLREALETIQREAFEWGQGEEGPMKRSCGDVLGHAMRLARAALNPSAQPDQEDTGEAQTRRTV